MIMKCPLRRTSVRCINYLGKIRTDRHYQKAKEELNQLLNKIPAIGGKLAKTAERLKDSLKYLL